jgi:serine/threonine protein kinase
MEYTGEGNLKSFMSTGKDNEFKKLAFFLDTVDAVIHLHKHSVLHRDLKPDNIFLSKTIDGNTNAKVGDFGLSCTLKEANLTKDGPGTPFYGSPEQLKGGSHGKPTDVSAVCSFMFSINAFFF